MPEAAKPNICGRVHTCEEIEEWAGAVKSVGKDLQAEKREVRRLRKVLRDIGSIQEISDKGSTYWELGQEALDGLKRPKR